MNRFEYLALKFGLLEIVDHHNILELGGKIKGLKLYKI